MASAFTQPSKSAWHYQWSVPFAFHASDLSVYFGPAGPNVGPDMVTAFRSTYNPSLDIVDVAPGSCGPQPRMCTANTGTYQRSMAISS